MKKSLAVVLACAMAATSLTACGGSGKQETAAPTTAKETEAAAESEKGTEAKETEAAASEDMGKELHFKLAENQPDGNPITEGMYKFAELAK